MKKIIIIALCTMLTLPLFAQKLTKEERKEQQKAAYELAKASIENRDWVIIPTSYIDGEGITQANTDNSNFISCEGENLFMQGWIVADNKYTNIAEATEYNLKVDKKGNINLRIKVLGRMIKGIYTIRMPKNNNKASVIFTPQGESAIKFRGEVVPATSVVYNKRSNPM